MVMEAIPFHGDMALNLLGRLPETESFGIIAVIAACILTTRYPGTSLASPMLPAHPLVWSGDKCAQNKTARSCCCATVAGGFILCNTVKI